MGRKLPTKGREIYLQDHVHFSTPPWPFSGVRRIPKTIIQIMTKYNKNKNIPNDNNNGKKKLIKTMTIIITTIIQRQQLSQQKTCNKNSDNKHEKTITMIIMMIIMIKENHQ